MGRRNDVAEQSSAIASDLLEGVATVTSGPIKRPKAQPERRQPAKPEPTPPAQPLKEERAPVSSGAVRSINGPTKRIRLSTDEADEIDLFLARLKSKTGSKVNLSQLARAGWMLAMMVENELVEEAEKRPLPRIPSTQDSAAYADYEEAVRDLPRRAIKRSKG